MKILYYLDTINRGGAETQAVDVCRNAADYGLDVTVVAGPGDLVDELLETGVEVIHSSRKWPIDRRVVATLRDVIASRRIEIVHAYQAVEAMHLYLATRRDRNVRRVMSFQGFIPDRKNRLSLRFLIPRSDANLYVSEGLREWIAEVDGLDTTRSSRILYNGADPRRLRPSGSSIREELGIDEGTLIFGMIANFYSDPRKDQLTLARALPRVFSEMPNAVCLFVGKTEPGAEHKLDACRRFCKEASISDRVHFLGGRGDVPDILSELDIFVLSSLQEGLPVAVTESMLAGLPTVLSDIPPHLEVTDSGRNASLFRTGDADDLADKLTGLLKDRELRERLGISAKRFAEENFSINAHMTRLRSIYAELLEGRRASPRGETTSAGGSV